MLFDLWVLCLVATGLGMYLVSVIGHALSYLRRHLQDRPAQLEQMDSPAAPIAQMG